MSQAATNYLWAATRATTSDVLEILECGPDMVTIGQTKANILSNLQPHTGGRGGDPHQTGKLNIFK